MVVMIGEIKNDARYIWTNHAQYKMGYYRISPSLVKRIVRFPERIEESIVDDLVAVMKKSSSKKEEIWVMYELYSGEKVEKPKIKIITTWRYPGKSSARDPIPEDILQEIKAILNR